MTMVRFATLCDHCGRRSEEYTTWPSCESCLEDVCLECAYPGTLTDDDGKRRAYCRSCVAAGYSDIKEMAS